MAGFCRSLSLVGLLSLSFSSVAQEVVSPLETLDCGGLEPHWGLEVDGNTATVIDMDMKEIPYVLTAVNSTSGYRNHWFYSAQEKGGKHLSFTIESSGQCGDSMSDFNYQYKVLLNVNDEEAFLGCCNRIK
uniref:hypothetical protein n=1 Tax=Thaumasiovibrio occultus TaxID=1891184 RepID=UPI000B3527D4|nr:hypothetical protein [Thaumasiovibrio occultus]